MGYFPPLFLDSYPLTNAWIFDKPYTSPDAMKNLWKMLPCSSNTATILLYLEACSPSWVVTCLCFLKAAVFSDMNKVSFDTPAAVILHCRILQFVSCLRALHFALQFFFLSLFFLLDIWLHFILLFGSVLAPNILTH